VVPPASEHYGQAMPNNWNDAIIEEFRANGGKVAAFAKQPLLLLHTIGAKSGEERVNPVAYLVQDGRTYVFATFAGRPMNPGWYYNLKSNPTVSVETGAETYEATAIEVTGADRDRIYADQSAVNPGFIEYEQKTTRVIPVIELIRS
jgi:deazaflavin-dependent oxidoreductase (nitroreductase family)